MPFITLKTSDRILSYSTMEAVIRNPIGKVSATLIEYIITIKEDTSIILCRLYKTREGFWYDPSIAEDELDLKTRYNIKAAIDAAENTTTSQRLFHI